MRVGNYALVALLGTGLVQGLFLPNNRFLSDTLLYSGDQFSCEAYCNGAMVMSYTNNCEGVFYAVCNIEGMNIVTSCVGTWDETISPQNKVDVKCTGLFNSNVDGSTPEGVPFAEHSSCGGSLDTTYYVKSQTSVIPSSPVNTTCTGNYAEGFELVKSADAADSLTVGGDNAYADAPPGYTCTYMCGDVTYDGVYCQKDFKLNCDVDEDGKKSTLEYTCDGIFVGDWSGDGCVGNGKVVSSGADYVYTEICTEYSGNKKGPKGEEKACVGTYSVATVVTPPSKPITFVM